MIEILEDRLFEALAHGDRQHRDWLYQAIKDHFAGNEVAPVRGGSRYGRLSMAVKQCKWQDIFYEQMRDIDTANRLASITLAMLDEIIESVDNE